METTSRPALPDRALERVDVSRKRPFELMVLALAEAARPLTYDEIAEHIARRGRTLSVVTLQKAWHGKPPIQKNAEGRLVLAAESFPHIWDRFVWSIERELGLIPTAAKNLPVPPKLDVESPISRAELEIGFAEPVPGLVSSGQVIGLVLEAAGRPLAEPEVEAEMNRQGLRLWPGSLAACGHNKQSPVRRTPERTWTVDPSLGLMREAREFVRKRVARKHQLEQWKVESERQRAEFQAQLRAAKARRARESKCIVRTFWLGERFVAGAVLDPDAHSVRSVHDVAELRRFVEACEVVIALDPRIELDRLGIDVGDRDLVSLRPPIKSKKLNRAGRILRISPELVYQGTIGRSDSLYDARKLAAYHRAGHIAKIERRLLSDAKALHDVYVYGSMHGYLRLRWGFLRELVPVQFGASWRGLLEDELKKAYLEGALVDVVLFSPPGWSDPWSRAMRCRIRNRGRFDATFESEGKVIQVALEDIYALRLAGEGGATGETRAHTNEAPASDASAGASEA